MEQRNKRLQEARRRAGFPSARSASNAYGWAESSYRAHETGLRKFGLEDAVKYALAFDVDQEWLWNATGKKPVGKIAIDTNVIVEGQRRLAAFRLLPNVQERAQNVAPPNSRTIPILGREAQ